MNSIDLVIRDHSVSPDAMRVIPDDDPDSYDIDGYSCPGSPCGDYRCCQP